MIGSSLVDLDGQRSDVVTADVGEHGRELSLDDRGFLILLDRGPAHNGRKGSAVGRPIRAVVEDNNGVLHGGDLRCFGRGIPWCLDQTLAAGGHQRRGPKVNTTPRSESKRLFVAGKT